MDEVAVARFADGSTFGVQLIAIEGPLPAGDDRLTTPTGLRERAESGITGLATLLSHVADEIGRGVAAIPVANRPSSVEAEVCLGLSAQAGPVWLSGKGEYTLKATFVWNT
ncbi:MAG TPA: hypothetical protein VFQ44_06425 [Streptosporangiaceae bacterium]|nr:hypothetical protein [Streptosporangiaceae bacterium]